MELENRWITSRFNATATVVNNALAGYRFHEATDAIYHFFWDDYANWYLEYVKPQIASINERDVDLAASNLESLTTLVRTFEAFMRLLHPFMPFITEELWQAMFTMHNGITAKVCGYSDRLKSIVLAPYPRADVAVDEAAELEMGQIKAFVTAVRNARAARKLIPRHLVDIRLSAPATAIQVIERAYNKTKHMANINTLLCESEATGEMRVEILNVIEVAKKERV